MSQTGNGWNEYSKLVINELERLSVGIDKLSGEIQDLKKDMSVLKEKEEGVKELKQWKQSIDEVASPTQLKETMNEVGNLKTFKTQAVTIFLIVQALVGIGFAILKYFS
jgi:predicted nuclease with TOPRIM domain